MLLRPTLIDNSRATNKCMTLNRIGIICLVYFILNHVVRCYYMPLRAYNFPIIALHWFIDPSFLEMVIVIGGCFYIRSVASRFCALNDAWKRLPQDLEEIPGEWTQSEITMSIECLRLLHADLCEIIKVFSLGYGMILLGYITLSFISLLMFTFMYFAVNYPSFDLSFKSIIVWCFPLIHSYCQYSIFHMSIVVYASLTNEKKREIISYLRSYRISNLPFHTKLQIKMFMNQMPEFESNVMSAYGIFNINLHFVLTNLILLFSGILTLIQMKDHPTISSISKTVMVYFIKQYGNLYNHTNS
uniref:Gustatory receptor n=1 Tax=Schizaphis graminum TaxID=13262 RepID=A0A2S2PP43_SCHGA